MNKSERYTRAKRVVNALTFGTSDTYNTANIREQLDAYQRDLTALGIANLPVDMVRERAEAIIIAREFGVD